MSVSNNIDVSSLVADLATIQDILDRRLGLQNYLTLFVDKFNSKQLAKVVLNSIIMKANVLSALLDDSPPMAEEPSEPLATRIIGSFTWSRPEEGK